MKTPDSTKAKPSALNSRKSIKEVQNDKANIDRIETVELSLVATTTEARIDSRQLAQGFGNKHRAVVALIDKYLDRFKSFGQVTFKKADGERKQGGGMAERYALLNEDQAYLLLSLTRNSDVVVKLKVKLIRTFGEARRAAYLRRTEYMPAYHAAHDRIKELTDGSPHARYHHMNFNKLLNKLAGVQAGQRASAPAPRQAMLIVGQMLALEAMQTARDGREAYQLACRAVHPLETAAAALGDIV